MQPQQPVPGQPPAPAQPQQPPQQPAGPSQAAPQNQPATPVPPQAQNPTQSGQPSRAAVQPPVDSMAGEASPQAPAGTNGDSGEVATPEQSREELSQAIQGSGEVIASATTALRLFPDTYTLDRAKITVTRREFFRTAEVVSIRIEDILNVTAQVGPLLGSLKVTSRIMSMDKPYEIHGFWRNDAIRLKRITQGYVIALQRQIDCSTIPAKELAAKLEQLGEDNHTDV